LTFDVFDFRLDKIQAFLCLLVFAGVYKSHNEATNGIRGGDFSGHHATVRFSKLLMVIRFDDKETMCQKRTQQTVSADGFNGFNTK